MDCPVAGGPEAAEAGTLNLFVGGSEKDFKRCEKILRVIGKKIYYLGPAGSGEAMKLINNLMVHMIRIGTLEAMSLALKAGINLRVMLEIISSSSGQSWIMSNMLPKISSKKKANVTIKNLYAVAKSIYDFSREMNVDLPLLETVMRVWSYYIAEGLGDKDLTEIATYIEKVLNVKITF